MDIIQQTSQDIPWEDTNYRGRLTNPSEVGGSKCDVTIDCEKIQVKRYEDLTYFRLVLPMGLVLSTEKDILLVLTRDDNYQLRIQMPMRSNITRVETAKIQWSQWVNNPDGGGFNSEDFLNQMRRLAPNQPYQAPITWTPDSNRGLIGRPLTDQVRFMASANMETLPLGVAADLEAMHGINARAELERIFDDIGPGRA